MKNIIKKELKYFFSSAIGYVTMAIFMLCNTLFLWVLEGNFNIFESGFADLNPFFTLSGWIGVFLIPALTMRLISEEKKSGMLEILFTKPISIFKIILGKYLGISIFLICILTPSFIFIFTTYQLALPIGNIDFAVIIGSYLALFLLFSAFSAVGLWASCLSKNQIVAFVISSFLNFFIFYGLDQILNMIFSDLTIYFGFNQHFLDLSRGVIDSRNVCYFLGFIALFLYISTQNLKQEKL